MTDHNRVSLMWFPLKDVGAGEMIADGRVKVKGDSELDRFTEKGVLFKDGSLLEADVIVLATG